MFEIYDHKFDPKKNSINNNGIYWGLLAWCANTVVHAFPLQTYFFQICALRRQYKGRKFALFRLSRVINKGNMSNLNAV